MLLERATEQAVCFAPLKLDQSWAREDGARSGRGRSHAAAQRMGAPAGQHHANARCALTAYRAADRGERP